MVTFGIKWKKEIWVKRNQQVRILTLLVLDFQNLCFWFWCLLGTPQNFLFGNARSLLPCFIKSRCGTSYPVEILEKDQRKGCKFWKSYHINYLEKVIYHSSTKMLSYLNLMSLFLSFFCMTKFMFIGTNYGIFFDGNYWLNSTRGTQLTDNALSQTQFFRSFR